jgi:hypothetical protein
MADKTDHWGDYETELKNGKNYPTRQTECGVRTELGIVG